MVVQIPQSLLCTAPGLRAIRHQLANSNITRSHADLLVSLCTKVEELACISVEEQDALQAAVERVRTETGYHVEKDPPNVMRSHGEKENGAHNVSCVEATVVAAALGGHGSDGEGDAGKEADDA